jgi:cyclic beta-1,2-glucan synthetase
MIDRLEYVFQALERMRRHRGHFFNWYELEGLNVLQPSYISTVDSGNLAGHLLALKQACREIIDSVPDTRAPVRALASALAITHESFADAASSGRVGDPARWQAVSKAAAMLKTARTEISEVVDDAGLERVSRALASADATLSAAGLPAKEASRAREWLAWAAHLAARHVTEHSELGAAASETPRVAAETNARIRERVQRLEAIAHAAQRYAMEMDFKFLYDARRKLFAIGTASTRPHSTTRTTISCVGGASRELRRDREGRRASGALVPAWPARSRVVASTALVSWSGSMFEYLMPLLVMRSFPADAARSDVSRRRAAHIDYAAERSVPWGISESAYNVRDRHMTYQYRAFGVPDLALKRGLGQGGRHRAVRHRARTARRAARSDAQLRDAGARGLLGPYGFRESVDFTRPDPGRRRRVACVHGASRRHELRRARERADGSRLAAPLPFGAAGARGGAGAARAHSSPARYAGGTGDRRRGRTRAGETEKPAVRQIETRTRRSRASVCWRVCRYRDAEQRGVRVQPLSSSSRSRDGARMDTRDDHGQWCYVRDLTEGEGGCGRSRTSPWASARIRTTHRSRWTASRSTGATRCRDTPGRDGGVRRQRGSPARDGRHHSGIERELELTSYGEIVLASPDADRAHPAFANLFVETEWREAERAILATRRPRASDEPRRWLAHVAAVGPEIIGDITFETDRAQFVGRGETSATRGTGQVGDAQWDAGAVLDPIFALRARIRLAPGRPRASRSPHWWPKRANGPSSWLTCTASRTGAQRALDLSWTRTQVELRDLGLTPAECRPVPADCGTSVLQQPTGSRAAARDARQPARSTRAVGGRSLW